ncbi:MAG: outer membrane lipoprotein carrier protein LolA [candidate division Zixibacteria bacterium]|nr:outer membrane lipoprotein carrier protein LolA [candidate division Zixibacteria bacterium]MDH3935816.1 outer membrane lipoprotein carrier protein LolA [candidate division Zixibacteria bacterium]MDH4032840.1 outer membrane lipoprotein carrier protein LolA [candidate division Zixibacteria bacterium]
MKTLRLLWPALGFVAIGHAATSEADRFEAVKTRLASAECVRLDFVNVIHSDIFDVVDSTFGSACLASDGRYRVRLGDDTYLYDGTDLHSYSRENNQVVIEAVNADSEAFSEVRFLTHLEEFFETQPQSSANSYRLLRRRDSVGDLPDSMTVIIHSEKLQIDRLEFFDINDEFNTIELLHQQLDSVCTEVDFIPNFPDSVETVKMP